MKKELIEVRLSKIAGNGVFAKKEIKKGETICFLDGERCSLDEIINRVEMGSEVESDPLGIDYELYIDLDELSRSFNHSCNPNTFLKHQCEMIAIRDISKNDEITFDYSTTMHYNESKILERGHQLWTCKCSCGAENCRKIIDQFKTLNEKEKTYYIDNKYLPDFILNQYIEII